MRERAFWSMFALPGAVWILIFFLIPLGLTVAISLGDSDFLGRPQFGFDFQNYRDALDPVFLPVVWRTLAYACASTALCLLLGFPVAYFIVRFGGRWKTVLLLMVVAPLLVNYLIRIYAWVTILSEEGVLNGLLGTQIRALGTDWVVIGGLAYTYLPFAILPMYAALARMDLSLIEAAKDLNASPRQALFHVTLPRVSQGIFTAAILVFLPAVGDFVVAQFLGGADTFMVGNLAYAQFFSAGNWPLASAFIVVLILIVLIPLVLYIWATRRAVERSAAA